MRNVTIYDTIAGFIGSMAEDPQDYLRKARVIGVQDGQKLYGKAYVSFFEPKNIESTSLPASASYFNKFVVPVDGKGATIPTIVMTKPVDTIVALSTAATFNPKALHAANRKDNHLKWKTSVPATDYLTAYTVIDDHALVLNRDTFKGDSNPNIRDIQILRLSNGDFIYHVLSNGIIFEAAATMRDLETLMMPAFKKRATANTFLTIPHRGEMAMLIGNNSGLFLNGKLINGTEHMRIEDIAADSETNRVYTRSAGMKYFGLQFDENWQPMGDRVVPIDDPLGVNYPWTMMLGGPAVTTDKGTPGLILSGWEKTRDGREYNETSRILELPPFLDNPPAI